MTVKRRLKNARITHISLCRKGRNKLKTVMKSGGRMELASVSKMDEKEGLLYTLVYMPDFADTDGDVMSASEIQKMAHGFLSNGGNIDVEHDLDSLSSDKVQIAETLVVQKGDDRFSDMTYEGKTIDPTGSWGVVLKILDPELKAAYAAGEWDGVSMFGQAEGTPVHKTETHPNTETEVMDEAQIAALTKALAAGTAAAVTAALAADREAELKKATELKKAEDAAKAAAKPKTIAFEGDPTNVADLAKHQEKLAVAQVDWNCPKSVAAYQATITKSDSDMTPAELEKSKLIAKHEKEIAELEKSSNVGGKDKAVDAKAAASADSFNLSKSEMEGADLGRQLMEAAFGKKPESK